MRLISLLLLTLNLSACYQNRALNQNTLIYCTERNPTLFNPQLSSDVASLDATTHQLFSRLVKLDPNTDKIIPDLAESWQRSEDQLRYRFKLRKNISFHHTDYFQPTRDFNANDVIFSFNRMRMKQHPYHTVNQPDEDYFFNHPFTHLLSKINIIDPYTIEFVLTKPDVTLLANLAAHYAVIHSEEYGNHLLQRGHPEKIDTQPIGTGPFKFKSYNNDGVIRYQKNIHYWQPMTNIENLIYVTNPSATKRYTKLVSGECDAIAYPAASQLTTISENKKVVLNSKATSNVALLAFNTQRELVKMADIRIALSQAIDKETILQAVYFQSAVKTNTLLSKQSWALKPRVKDDIYNPEQAKKNLQLLSYDFSKTLTILLPENADVFNPNFHKTAELIQANLADVGVKSTIISLSGQALRVRLLTGNYDTYLTGFNVHVNDPDSLFRPLLSCDSPPEYANSSRWCSPKVQTLLDNSLTETNFAQRIKNYYHIQDEIYEQRPYLPIAHVLRIDAISSSILNVEVNPLTGINFQNAIKQDLH